MRVWQPRYREGWQVAPRSVGRRRDGPLHFERVDLVSLQPETDFQLWPGGPRGAVLKGTNTAIAEWMTDSQRFVGGVKNET
ncbi:hypothetical protein MESS2_730220 [Mesorhizobium metallidurans STM 2683]|uniref:Uncharacterized protein n=1 Tax=Mesorhizobium metallidurans STM 2683 TaxID=1297569 RepID=M5ETM3_9HYPH|nr:hypothetical protein MESS2_730220 [Mesorhizobium metallidurans STM 2683]